MSTDTRYRFVVRSAEEAVKVLRERLGDHARVVSVRQLEGAGLSRFLSSPKLEVVAEVAGDQPGETEMPSVSEQLAAAQPGTALLPPPALDEPELDAEPDSLLGRLHRAGVPRRVLARLQSEPIWESAERLPLREACAAITERLKAGYDAIPRSPLGRRVAFLGTPGVGKTTALCKRLAIDVFMHHRPACVWKVDTDRVNPADGLAVFCDALGVPLIRSSDEAAARPPGETLYLDLPGFIPGSASDAENLSFVLSQYEIESRVLVVNAAYDTDLIKRAYQTAAELGGTHVVFTHLDELTRWGKLWEFLLQDSLTPLFFSRGPNIAGDLIEQMFYAVAERTFPARDAALQPATV